MRIAYVYDAVYPWVKGGAEKRVYEIARRLVDRGHEVHWFGLKWWEGKEDIVMEGINIHGVGKWDNLYVDGRRSIKEGLYFGIKTLTGLKGDFDIIDCQEFPYFSCFSAKIHSLLKNNLVITWHEVWADYWYEYLGWKGMFGKFIEKQTAKLADYNIAVSEMTKINLEGILEKKIEVIPNGIEFDSIQNVRKSDERSDVIFVGRLIKEKNVDVLIKAINILKDEITDVKCLIIGDGSERTKLEKSVLEFKLEDNVEFLGFLEKYDDVISHMKSSKVFILPSIREGFGIVVLEAMACRLPVIGINHPNNAATELIKDGKNGFLVELSPKIISNKIKFFLNNDKIRKERGINALNYIKKYDWEKIVDETNKFYYAALAQTHSPKISHLVPI